LPSSSLPGTTGRRQRHDARRSTPRRPLVFDFDDNQSTETLDTQSQGIDYYIPFDLITSIVPRDGDARGTSAPG
jgi:hypothetical protein